MHLRKLIRRIIVASAIMTAQLISNEENLTNRSQFVLPNTVDIRGTWCSTENWGSWKIQKEEWAYNRHSIKQYGTNILGESQIGLYGPLAPFTGSIQSNKLVIIYPSKNSLEFTIEDNKGVGIFKSANGKPHLGTRLIERYSTNYLDRTPPKE